jgi:hypothetical protein
MVTGVVIGDAIVGGIEAEIAGALAGSFRRFTLAEDSILGGCRLVADEAPFALVSDANGTMLSVTQY